MSTVFQDKLEGLGFKRTDKRETTSILKKFHIVPKKRDGHINVSRTAEGLGKKLDMSYYAPFKHPFGKFKTFEIFMCYLNTPDFPTQLLVNPSSSLNRDLIAMKLNRLYVPNYWAVIMEGMWYKFTQDTDLLAELVATKDTPFTSYHTETINTKVGTGSMTRYHYHNSMGRYVGCLTLLRQYFIDMMEVKGTFETEELEDKYMTDKLVELIEATKDEKDKDIYADLAFVE